MDSFDGGNPLGGNGQAHNEFGPADSGKGQGLANAALTMGIISVVGAIFILPPMILGSTAIVLALLSRGGDAVMSPRARTGLITASVGLAAGLALFSFSLYYLLSHAELLEELIRQYDI
ncbi:MAG: hypothetical protein J6O55_04775 [Lachnospiraceae bacterium]|nr:hypothetical protein [Lachnospiraceae bacterium]